METIYMYGTTSHPSNPNKDMGQPTQTIHRKILEAAQVKITANIEVMQEGHDRRVQKAIDELDNPTDIKTLPTWGFDIHDPAVQSVALFQMGAAVAGANSPWLLNISHSKVRYELINDILERNESELLPVSEKELDKLKGWI